MKEYVYIQRTGENLIDLDGKTIKMTQNGSIGMNNVDKTNSTKKIEEVDEEGFTVVKNKKKNKMNN